MLKSPARSRTTPKRQPWLSRLGIEIRADERRLCAVLFSAHFLILTFQYIAKPIRQAAYVDTLGAEKLPWVYLLIALCSYPVLRLFGRLADHSTQQRMLVATSLLTAVGMGVFWWLFAFENEAWRRGVSVAFYWWISIVGVLLVSQVWAYSSHLLNPRQAKRLFGIIGAGGVLGSIVGGQLARWVSEWLDTRTALLAAVLALLGAAALIRFRGLPSGEQAELPASAESLDAAKDGLALVRGSRYLQLIAAAMLISAMVSQCIDLQFSWAVEQHTTAGLEERTKLFGNLYSIMGAAAFLFQLFFTSRIHRQLGVGTALRVLPTVAGIGTSLFGMAALGVAATILPQIWLLRAAWLLKISDNGLRYSLDQATRELLFQPVDARERPKAKAFIDVFVQRFAKGLAALLLLSVTFGKLSVEHTAIFSLVGLTLWWMLSSAIQRRYVASYRDSLLRGTQTANKKIDLSDAATLEVLVEGLGSIDAREVLNSLELLSDHGRGRLVSPMLLHHPDPTVRCRTLQILQQEQRGDAAPMIEKLLVDPNPTVRATATLALVALSPHDIQQTMLERLRDPDVRVRAAAVGYLVSHGDAQVRRRADAALTEMLADGDAQVRLEAARAIGGIEEPHYQAGLVQLLYDSDPQVVRSAIDAVSQRVRASAGGPNPLYVPILVSHLRSRKLKHDARAALVSYGEDVVPALQHFLGDQNEEIWVRRALPKTIARIGGHAAIRALSAGLTATDPFLRRKVIEALGGLRHRERIELDPSPVEAQLVAECRAYLRTLLDLLSLRQDRPLPMVGPVVAWSRDHGRGDLRLVNEAPHLLEDLISDRMSDHLGNLFGLLALLYPPTEIRASYRSLLSGNPALRAHAVEFLENRLQGDTRRLVLTVIDDLSLDERIRRANRLFALSASTAGDTLRRLASTRPAGDADAAWLTAAALHYIFEQRLEKLYPVIEQAAEHDSAPLVQETTEYLLRTLAEGGTVH